MTKKQVLQEIAQSNQSFLEKNHFNNSGETIPLDEEINDFLFDY